MDPSTHHSNIRTLPIHPWDGFLIGPENSLAHAAAVALAKGEGTSPLIIHGPSGVGKSRLLASITAERIARRPESAIALLNGDDFVAQCVEADNHAVGWITFRGRFRALDLFALDDLQALGRSPMAIAELIHTLDALDQTGSVVVTARSAPTQWTTLPKRLVDRLIAGLIICVDPPSLLTRRRYVLDRARHRGLTLSANSVDALAEAADGYGVLDGLLARLTLEARVHSRPIEHRRIEELLAEDGLTPVVAIEQIVYDVARQFGLSARDLRSASRRSTLIIPRHLAIYFARQHTGLSFVALASYFGHRDAATIRHACRASVLRLAGDPALAATASALEKQWRLTSGEIQA